MIYMNTETEYLIDTPTVYDADEYWIVTGTVRRENLPNVRVRVTYYKAHCHTEADARQSFEIAASFGAFDHA
jgi:hypothetical protein